MAKRGFRAYGRAIQIRWRNFLRRFNERQRRQKLLKQQDKRSEEE